MKKLQTELDQLELGKYSLTPLHNCNKYSPLWRHSLPLPPYSLAAIYFPNVYSVTFVFSTSNHSALMRTVRASMPVPLTSVWSGLLLSRQHITHRVVIYHRSRSVYDQVRNQERKTYFACLSHTPPWWWDNNQHPIFPLTHSLYVKVKVINHLCTAIYYVACKVCCVPQSYVNYCYSLRTLNTLKNTKTVTWSRAMWHLHSKPVSERRRRTNEGKRGVEEWR